MPSEWAYEIAREQRRDVETMAANLDAARAEGKTEGRIEGLMEAADIALGREVELSLAAKLGAHAAYNYIRYRIEEVKGE